MINDLIKKLRKAADVLEELLDAFPDSNKKVAALIGKDVEKNYVYKVDYDMARLVKNKRKAMQAINTSFNQKALRQPKTKKHWTQNPKNRKKVMARVRLMRKALKAKNAPKVS